MTRPLAIDLFTGLHGWADGLVAEGFRVVGFDLEDMSAQFGQPKPPHFQLVIQDVLTLHGSQFRDAAVIVASPPCQEFSYMAMPWSLAKAKAAAIRADETGTMLADLTRLFDACFRIQREACEAAARHIPMVVENVRGAQPWVGEAKANYGSFYLFGDAPVPQPGLFGTEPRQQLTRGRQVMKAGVAHRSNGETNFHGHKTPGRSLSRDAGKKFGTHDMGSGEKIMEELGLKCGGDWFNASQPSLSRLYSSKSPARKAASAMIAKIPLSLSKWIASCYYPNHESSYNQTGRNLRALDCSAGNDAQETPSAGRVPL